MSDRIDSRTVDIVLFVVANLVNLLVIGIFLARPQGLERVESILGLVLVAMALPVGVVLTLNVLQHREWWTIVLPLPLILFCILELLFDYVLKLEFRETALLWPYLGTFYLALMGMIGYSFSIGKGYGFVTLGTYFLNLLATWYSYSRVGHG